MDDHDSEEKRAALVLTEELLVSLRRLPDPDPAVRYVIESLENDQAELLASLLDNRSRNLNR